MHTHHDEIRLPLGRLPEYLPIRPTLDHGGVDGAIGARLRWNQVVQPSASPRCCRFVNARHVDIENGRLIAQDVRQFHDMKYRQPRVCLLRQSDGVFECIE